MRATWQWQWPYVTNHHHHLRLRPSALPLCQTLVSRVILLYTLLVLFEVDKQKAKNMPRDEENASDMWQ